MHKMDATYLNWVTMIEKERWMAQGVVQNIISLDCTQIDDTGLIPRA